MLPHDAADTGALVAIFAVDVGVKHPVVAVQTQLVTGLLRRRHPRQRNVGEYPDWRVFALVVLVVAVLDTVV